MAFLAIEKEFEDAVATFMQPISILADLPFTLFKGFSDENFLTPRCDITSEDLNFVDELDEINGKLEYRKFDLSISLRVVTDIVEQTNRDSHYIIVDRIRNAMLRNADNFNATNLANYNVAYLRLDSSTNLQEGDLRMTETTYSIRATMK